MNGHPEPSSKLALISVSDKSGITEFARRLTGFGFSILSTGGTARTLADAGIEVAEVRYHSSQPWPFPSSIMLGFHEVGS